MSSRRFSKQLATSTLALVACAGILLSARTAIEVLSAVGGLPPQIVGQLREPAAFIETPDGRSIVFDRRAQSVFVVDAARTSLKKLISVGPSDGEILQPLAFVAAPNRTFSILDHPDRYERVQTFHDTGTALSVFRQYPDANTPMRLNLDSMVSSGFGPMAALDRDLLTQIPDGVALMSQVNSQGHIVRRIGLLRPTGQELDANLHRALNSGIPLVAPDGSLYFVFTAGIPMFRKYSATGELIFERHVEGPELDAPLQTLPTQWDKRRIDGREFPYVTNTILAAAVDPRGQLWISLGVPATYVYDADGNKTRTVQFRGAGVISPKSFFFATASRLLVTPGCYEFKAQ